MKKIFNLTFCFCLFFGFSVKGQIITTIAGHGGTSCAGGEGGQATAACLSYCNDVIFDLTGNFYIAEGCTSSSVKKVNTSGIISFYAGNCTYADSGDGGPATAAEIKRANAIAMDSTGNLYIVDYGAQVIRKVNTSGIILTIAGNTITGFSGDGGPATAAEFNTLSGLCVDKTGNIYAADAMNNRIRKIDKFGTISTFAGTGAGIDSGDGGPASAARLNIPQNISVDNNGNLFISTIFRIRKVNSSGIISTVAGNDSLGYKGDGGPATAARLNTPLGVAFDNSGNMFFADSYNNVVRMVNTSGIISTIAGTGTAGFSGDGSAATAAELNTPTRIAVDIYGNLYVAEFYNNDVRKITGLPNSISEIQTENFISIYPNPAKNLLTINLSSIKGKTVITIYNIIGQQVLSEPGTNKPVININTELLPEGLYFIHIQTEDGTIINSKVEIVK